MFARCALKLADARDSTPCGEGDRADHLSLDYILDSDVDGL